MIKHIMPIINEADIAVIISPPFSGKSTIAQKAGRAYTINKLGEFLRGKHDVTLDKDDFSDIKSPNYPVIIFDEIQSFGRSQESQKSLMKGVDLAIKHNKKVIFCGQNTEVLKKLRFTKYAFEKEKKLILVNLESWDVQERSPRGFRAIEGSLEC